MAYSAIPIDSIPQTSTNPELLVAYTSPMPRYYMVLCFFSYYAVDLSWKKTGQPSVDELAICQHDTAMQTTGVDHWKMILQGMGSNDASRTVLYCFPLKKSLLLRSFERI